MTYISFDYKCTMITILFLVALLQEIASTTNAATYYGFTCDNGEYGWSLKDQDFSKDGVQCKKIEGLTSDSIHTLFPNFRCDDGTFRESTWDRNFYIGGIYCVKIR